MLLVEDNPSDAALVRCHLGRARDVRYEVVAANTLMEGLCAASSRVFDAIVLDLALPDSLGLEGLDRLAAVTPSSAIIVLTGVDDPTVGLLAVQAGAQDYLVKHRVDAHMLERALLCAVERKRLHGRTEHLAYRDALTGLANRNTFYERLAAVLTRSTTETRFAVMVADLDDFKPINDQFGHLVGDRVLVEVARRLTDAVRMGDTVARLGGDEFALLVESVGNDRQIQLVGDRILRDVSRPIRVGDVEVTTSMSLGVALFPEVGGTEEQLVEGADSAMYVAKRNAGNAWRRSITPPPRRRAV